MREELVEVKVMGVLPSNTGVAVFLGNGEKTFSIHVDHGVGQSIIMLLRDQKRERPITHDLIRLIFRAFQISVERIVINDLRNDTYFARLTLKMENEVQRRMCEIDARPSDCLAIALEEGKPVFVAKAVWEKVSDISALIEDMKKKMEEGEGEDPFGMPGEED
jgi:uncharacterized protein